MAYAGLSGAFGTVSLGQVWSASFNHVGGITDGSWFYGNSETSYRVGNALSYAMSAGAISMQLDAIMDGAKDSGDAVDQLEFGMTIDLGDVGKVGLAYVDTKDHTTKVEMFKSVSKSTTTVTADVATELMGDVNAMLTGDVTASLGELSIEGGVTADVNLNNFMFGLADIPSEPAGYCDGDTGLLVGQSTCSGNDDVFLPVPGQTVPLANADRARVDMPTATIELAGTSDIEDVTNVRHLDTDGNMLTKQMAWRWTEDGATVSDNQTLDDNSRHHEDCVNENAATTQCIQIVRYLDEDGDPVDDDNVRHVGSVDLGKGTLRVEGGKLTFTNTLGVEVDLNDVEAISSLENVVSNTETTTETTKMMGDKHHTGSRATHIAAQFNLGAVTGYLGYSQSEENGSGMKDKTTHYGVSGGLGDTGMSFHLMARNKDNASGMDTNPWLVGLTKGLGGGATVMVEHGNADDGASGKTRFGLKVDF